MRGICHRATRPVERHRPSLCSSATNLLTIYLPALGLSCAAVRLPRMKAEGFACAAERRTMMAHVAKSYSKPHRRTPKRLKRRDCLRCDRKVLSEGPDHPLCPGCRQSIASCTSSVEEYSLVVLYERGRPVLKGMSML